MAEPAADRRKRPPSLHSFAPRTIRGRGVNTTRLRYGTDDVMSMARKFTGFTLAPPRSNYEIDEFPEVNYIDNMVLAPENRDPFPAAW